MKKSSISIKIFIFTAGFFILYATLSLLLQSMFIENFYMNEKTRSFDKNFKIFVDNYSMLSISSQDTSKTIYEFEVSNNANIAIINLSDNSIIIRGKKETFITYNLAASEAKKLGIIGPAIREWLGNSSYYDSVVKNKETIVYNSRIKFKELNCITGVSPIKEDIILISVTSLQPIDEAAAVIKKFSIYSYITAVILFLLFTRFFSKNITKPLIELNHAAQKMSQLDFSIKCNVERKDEIGNLAKTLNFLSSNLDDALNELKAANEKLTEDIAKEKALDKLRKEFVADVSHELKTPVSIISGYAEAIKDNILEGSEKEYLLDLILDESRKMSLLINDMLDLSQMESGHYKLNLDKFSITSMINSIIQRHTKEVEKAQINLIKEFCYEDIIVYGDRLRINQVVTNLLNNAIKHTPRDNFIIISISQVPEDHQVAISIENNGTQIDENELKNIWDKFYKVDKSRTKSINGTGLGLSIVRDILELHKTNYGVTNTTNGVKFYFQLKKA